MDDDHPMHSESPQRLQDLQEPDRQSVGYDIELVASDEDDHECETPVTNTAQRDHSGGMNTIAAVEPPVATT